jgi:hypothetical protein
MKTNSVKPYHLEKKTLTLRGIARAEWEAGDVAEVVARRGTSGLNRSDGRGQRVRVGYGVTDRHVFPLPAVPWASARIDTGTN